jgi:hypothetical protein
MKFEKCYPADMTATHWRGHKIVDLAEFDLFLKGAVKARVTDAEFENVLAGDLQALATTQMASETLATVLSASYAPLDWEIGEAIAECLLEQEFNACWPWNENRDRKTPRASLPGADLVGFIGENDDATLLFGEVKTSSDKNQPPGVMAGRSGLVHQIDKLATSPKIQASLLRWLFARCRNTLLWTKFETACKRYIGSGGKDFELVGVLLRDTLPHEDDLRTRGEALAALGQPLPKVRLDAWYAPRAINEWVGTVMSETT